MLGKADVGLAYRLADYEPYLTQVGEASIIDVSRRTDPARIARLWDNLAEVVRTYGPPWVVQLWTKDPATTAGLGGELLRRLASAGTTLTAQVTITGLAGTVWEPGAPTTGFVGLRPLIELIGGPVHITWRYDPIIPTVHTPARYRHLAEQAASLGITRNVINFLAPPGRYVRVDRRLAALLPGWASGMPGYDPAWREAIARQLVEIAADLGIDVACCAECAELGARVPGLRRAACGGYAWFAHLSGRDPGEVPYGGSRPGCGCARYFDVGNYGQWSQCHRCVYCYAG